jgi:class 3 adenylate cyclase
MKFCGGCGASLVPAAEGECREVAILFADICDFAALVSRSDPEETKEKVDACLRMMAEQIATFGGVVEKFIGDAVMAVFGLPVAYENDAERAVRAGVRLLEQVRWFGPSAGLDLELRVGVHRGEVITAPQGAAGPSELGVFGDAVNLAARLEATGEAGAVVVSEAVRERTAAVFDYDELPAVRVKGFAEPLQRYRVRGEKAERGKVRGIPGLAAPMVGRDRCLADLIAAYDAVGREGNGRVVAVVGEPGIGKTRLVEEFARALLSRGDAPWLLSGRGVNYGGPSYFPLLDVLRGAAEIKEDTPAAEARGRIRAMVREAWGEEKVGDVDAPAIFNAVVGLDDLAGGRETGQIQAQILLVVERLFAAWAAKRRLVVVVEDAQWADEATWALIKHLARNLRGAPYLLILNARPVEDYGAAFRELFQDLSAHADFIRLDLEDLTPDESRQLIGALLTIDRLPPTARDLIAARAGGNPFFVEELIKSLIDAGVLVRVEEGWAAARDVTTLELPASIEEVLRARVDGLARAYKRTLQRAAVVGRVFWSGLVAALLEENVGAYLDELERRDFVRRRRESVFKGEEEYVFKHALLRDAAYASLLRRVRRGLHLKAAQWLEARAGTQTEGHFPAVAYHLEQGGDKARAATYYLKAADRAAALYATDEARKWYAQAAALGSSDDARYAAYMGEGEVCLNTNANDDALTYFESARGYCTTVEQEAAALCKMATAYEQLSAYTPALEYYGWAEDLLGAEPAGLVAAQIAVGVAWVLYLKGDHATGLGAARRAERILDALPAGDAKADACRARVYSVIGSITLDREGLAAAGGYFEKTLALYEKHGDLFGCCSILNNIGTGRMVAGLYDEAHSYLERSFALAERCGDRLCEAINSCNFGEIFFAAGDFERAREYAALYLALNAAVGNRLGDGYANGILARVAAAQGNLTEAERRYREAIAVFEEVRAEYNAWDTKLSLAGVLAVRGDYAASDALFASLKAERDTAKYRVARVIAAADAARAQGVSDGRRPAVAAALAEMPPAPYAELDFGEVLALTGAAAALYAHLGEPERAAPFRAEAERLAAELRRHLPPGVPGDDFERHLRRHYFFEPEAR